MITDASCWAAPTLHSPSVARVLEGDGRFTMTATANGFLRLDTRTGAVSLCVVQGGTAQCRVAADERTALDSPSP